MALKDILLALEGEAKRQNEEILARAKSQAAELIAEANEAAEAIISGEIEQAREQLRAKEAKIILAAKFKTKRRSVEVKESLADQVFREAERRLLTLNQLKDYPRVFANMVEEAIKVIGDQERVVVDVSKQDVSLARSILAKSKLDWAIEPSADGKIVGVIISSKDGRKVLTNTVESRLKRAKTLLRDQIGAVLFK